jgi:hypothetical protein
MVYQYYVADGRLSGTLYQRSADVFLGLGWNICEAALLIHMLAQQTGLAPGELIWMGGDVHLYLNHIDQAQEQLGREPRPLPELRLTRRPATIFDYRYEDFELVGYRPHATIAAKVAVLTLLIRNARPEDASTIVRFIRALADYERLSTPPKLRRMGSETPYSEQSEGFL